MALSKRAHDFCNLETLYLTPTISVISLLTYLLVKKHVHNGGNNPVYMKKY